MRARGSAISDWKQCRRLYGFRWVDGWQSKLPNANLLTGTLVHAGLACVHQGKPGDAPRAIHDALLANVPTTNLSSGQIQIVEQSYELSNVMVAAYIEHYGIDREAGRTLSVEAPFEVRVNDRHTLTGTIDRLADNAEGELEVWEHKTTSDTRAEYDLVAAIRWQTYGYYIAGRKLTGRWPKHVIYNILGKPTLRQGKKENRAEYLQRVAAEYKTNGSAYFRRVKVRIGLSAIQEYVEQLKGIMHDMEYTPRKLYYPNDGYCTRGRGAACEFLDTCAAYRSAPDERLFAKTHDKVDV